MKKRLTLLCLLFLIVLSACRDKEVTVTTRVFADGSFERTIVIKADSSDIYEGTLPVPIDSSWTVDIRKSEDEKDEGKLILTATKHFDDVDALNASAIPERGPSGLMLTSTFERRFRWFFTFVTYKESFGLLDIFKTFSISEYLTEEEIASLNKGESAEWESLSEEEKKYWEAIEDSASDKAERWWFKSIFERIDEAVRPLAEERGIFLPAKDSIFTDLEDSDIDSVVEVYSDYLSDEEEAILGRHPDVRRLDQQLSYLFDAIFWNEEYNFEIVMPGLILSSNAEKIAGNVARWGDIKGEDFLAFLLNEGHWAESRVVNWWAFGVSAAVLLLATISFIVSAFRSRQSA